MALERGALWTTAEFSELGKKKRQRGGKGCFGGRLEKLRRSCWCGLVASNVVARAAETGRDLTNDLKRTDTVRA